MDAQTRKREADKLEVFQDKVKDFILAEAKKDGLNLVHWDALLLFKIHDDGAYAATSCKTKSLPDFWEDAKPTDLFSMYDLATAVHNHYKQPTIEMIANLIWRKLEELDTPVVEKMLEVLKQISEDCKGDGKLIADELNNIARAEEADDIKMYEKALYKILTLLR